MRLDASTGTVDGASEAVERARARVRRTVVAGVAAVVLVVALGVAALAAPRSPSTTSATNQHQQHAPIPGPAPAPEQDDATLPPTPFSQPPKQPPTNVKDLPAHLRSLEDNIRSYYANRPLLATFASAAAAAAGSNPDDEPTFPTITTRLAAAIHSKRPFVVGAVGSHTIGGFANCRTARYLNLFQAALAPLLKAAGSSLVVRDVVLGPWCGSSPLAASLSSPELWSSPPLDELHVSFPEEEASMDSRTFKAWRASLQEHFPHLAITFIEPSCSRVPPPHRESAANALLNVGGDVACVTRALDALRLKNRQWGVSAPGRLNQTRAGEAGILFRSWALGPMGHQILADALILQHSIALRHALTTQPSPAASSPEPEPQAPPPRDFIAPFSTLTPATASGWTPQKGDATSRDEIPPIDQSRPECSFSSVTCPAFAFSGDSTSPATFTINIRSQVAPADVFVCCCCNGALCVAEQLLARTVRLSFDDQDVEIPNAASVSDSRFPECVRLASRTDAGTHTLSVRLLEPGHVVKLGRVLWVPSSS